MGEVRIAGTWRTSAAPADVWAVITDLRTWPQWWPAIRDVEPLAGEARAPDAARLTFDVPRPLRPLVVDVEVAEREPPHHLVVVPTSGPLGGTGRIAVEPDGNGGSATAYDLRLRVRSLLLRPVERVLANAARGAGQERLHKAGDDLAVLAGGEPGDHEP